MFSLDEVSQLRTNTLSTGKKQRSLDTWSLHREELVVVGLDRDCLVKHL
ncbi:hypothetical protein HanIR_Chr05g0223361 [Helianthus annuus]|nr:hypothetical protein HanIR_Chr05g0223361 [Helianthus annuus]